MVSWVEIYQLQLRMRHSTSRFWALTCWMRLMRLSSVSAMYSVPRWDRAMALAASRVARTAAHFTRWWSMPGTWQWMGRPATIRTCRLSDTWPAVKHKCVWRKGAGFCGNFNLWRWKTKSKIKFAVLKSFLNDEQALAGKQLHFLTLAWNNKLLGNASFSFIYASMFEFKGTSHGEFFWRLLLFFFFYL